MWLPSAPEAAKFASVLSGSFKYCLVMVTVLKHLFPTVQRHEAEVLLNFPLGHNRCQDSAEQWWLGAASGTARLGSPQCNSVVSGHALVVYTEIHKTRLVLTLMNIDQAHHIETTVYSGNRLASEVTGMTVYAFFLQTSVHFQFLA